MGAGSAEVSDEPWVARSHSRETTFQHNVTDWGEVAEHVRRLAERVTEDIRAEKRPGVRVEVKLRYAPFFTRTTSRALPDPTLDPSVISTAAVSLLERFDHERQVRLVGVRVEMVETG